jgi:hypothetical protein
LAARRTLAGMAVTERERYEAALRRLPLAHSLALRLKDGGAADEVICDYLHIKPEGLAVLLLIAHYKLAAELAGDCQ